MATGTKKEVIGIAQVNPNVIKAQYAVRGPILDTVNAVEKQLQQVRKICCTKGKRSRSLVAWACA